MTQIGSKIEVSILAPSALAPEDVAAWRALQAANPAFASPLLGPDFAQAVGRVRKDAHVAVYREGGHAIGFLPFHSRPGGLGRPIGAPFSDYQALVSTPDFALTGAQALTAAGLKAFRFNGLVDPYQRFSALQSQTDSFAITISTSPEDYLESLRAASPKRFKNQRRLRHRLDELGEVRFGEADRPQEALEQLLNWKSEQFRRTGLQDVLRPAWVRTLMFDLLKNGDGLLLTLHVGDQLAAGHFGVRNATVYHPWIASANPDLAAVSPGQAFLHYAIEAMPGLGLETYDLGPGHAHYKLPYANVTRQTHEGLITSASNPGAPVMAYGREGGLLDKVRRRLDHIAAIDPSPTGRVYGLAEAVFGASRRGLGNETASTSVG